MQTQDLPFVFFTGPIRIFGQFSVSCGFAGSIFFVGHGYGHALLIQTASLRSGFASLDRNFDRRSEQGLLTHHV